MRKNRIEGVLHQSLWKQVLITLNLTLTPDAVQSASDLSRKRVGKPDEPLPPGIKIFDVYKEQNEELLILGEPGSGKTTYLLSLAETLLATAEADEQHPVPVILELSAWQEKHKEFDLWIIEQLNTDYGIPEKTGKRWVEAGSLLLLLDGLDEVAQERRAACVKAINHYKKHKQEILRPMVVCCRVKEYEEIPDLQLQSAILIQPLDKKQIDAFLKQGGQDLMGLRQVLQDEPDLYEELFPSPLFLHVAVITYAGQSASQLRKSVTPEERRQQLWDAYIEEMFQRKQEARTPTYHRERALIWLSWLGYHMDVRSHQVYQIESMQPSDLSKKWQHITVIRIVPYLVSAWYFIIQKKAFYYNYVVGYGGLIDIQFLFIAFIGYSPAITPEPVRTFVLRDIKKWNNETFAAMSYTIFFASLIGLVVLIFVTLTASKIIGSIMAFSVVIVAVLSFAMSIIFDEEVPNDSMRPNDGILRSGRTVVLGIFIGLVLGSFVGIVTTAFRVQYLMKGALLEGLGGESGIALVLFEMVTGGVIGAVGYGGRAFLQHYTLRFFLWTSCMFPRNITRFLDYCVGRVLLQRVGGGWKFIHRSLQEHFAERYYETHPEARPKPVAANP